MKKSSSGTSASAGGSMKKSTSGAIERDGKKMEAAVELTRRVARMFYDNKCIVIVDYLTNINDINERLLSDETLSERLHCAPKEIQRMGAFLRDERLIRTEQRSEQLPGRNATDRPITRTYFYVDYPRAVKAIRSRIDRMRAASEGRLRDDAERRGYRCPSCGRSWSQLDVHELSINPSTMSFMCDICGMDIEDDPSSNLPSSNGITGAAARMKPQDLHASLMDTVAPLIQILKRIKIEELPLFSPNEWFKRQAAVKATVTAIEEDGGKKDLKMATSDEKPALGVSVVLPGEEDTTGGQSRELPIWYTHSTVTGERATTEPIRQPSESSLPPTKKHRVESVEIILDLDKDDAHSDNPVIVVRGRPKPFSSVTDDDKRQMTSEEYDIYFEHFLRIQGNQ